MKRALTQEEHAHLEQRCSELLSPLADFVRTQIAQAPVPPSKLIAVCAEVAPGVLDFTICERAVASRSIDALALEPDMKRVVIGAIGEPDDDSWLRIVLFLHEGTVSTRFYLPGGYLGEA